MRFLLVDSQSRWATLVRSRGEKPLVLALLPVDPGAAVGTCGEPALDGASQFGFALEARRERELVEPHGMSVSKLPEAAEPVQLG
jgi:hypothetical protein